MTLMLQQTAHYYLAKVIKCLQLSYFFEISQDGIITYGEYFNIHPADPQVCSFGEPAPPPAAAL